MECDTFYLETLQKHTRYSDFLRQMGGDEVVLDEIAEALTEQVRTHRVTRWSMLCSLGKVSVVQKLAVERILQEEIGTKADWKVVVTGADYVKANAVSRFLACLLTPLPTIWIRIAL